MDIYHASRIPHTRTHGFIDRYDAPCLRHVAKGLGPFVTAVAAQLLSGTTEMVLRLQLVLVLATALSAVGSVSGQASVTTATYPSTSLGVTELGSNMVAQQHGLDEDGRLEVAVVSAEAVLLFHVSQDGYISLEQSFDDVNFPGASIEAGAGYEIQLVGDVLAFSNPASVSSRGIVHVFRRSAETRAWQHVKNLTPANLKTGNPTKRFGAGLGMSDDAVHLVVGAPRQEHATMDVGSGVVYFYAVSDAIEAPGDFAEDVSSRSLGPSETQTGTAVAVAMPYAVVTRQGSGSPLIRRPRVYRYDSETSEWSGDVAALENYTPTPGGTSPDCGRRCAVDSASMRVAVTCRGEDDSGAVHLWQYDELTDTWPHQSVLQLSSEQAAENGVGTADWFGDRISFSANPPVLLVAAPQAGAASDGSLLWYRRSSSAGATWELGGRVDVGATDAGDAEGSGAVVVHDSLFLTSSPGDDSLAADHGVLRLVHLNCPQGQQYSVAAGTCVACPAGQTTPSLGFARCTPAQNPFNDLNFLLLVAGMPVALLTAMVLAVLFVLGGHRPAVDIDDASDPAAHRRSRLARGMSYLVRHRHHRDPKRKGAAATPSSASPPAAVASSPAPASPTAANAGKASIGTAAGREGGTGGRKASGSVSAATASVLTRRPSNLQPGTEARTAAAAAADVPTDSDNAKGMYATPNSAMLDAAAAAAVGASGIAAAAGTGSSAGSKASSSTGRGDEDSGGGRKRRHSDSNRRNRRRNRSSGSRGTAGSAGGSSHGRGSTGSGARRHRRKGSGSRHRSGSGSGRRHHSRVK